MAILGGVIKDAISQVGLFNGMACITGTLTCESCDANGVWVWGTHTTVVVFVGQSLSFSAYGHDPVTMTIPNPDANGYIWMVVSLNRSAATPSSCFTADTKVLMEDGSEREIAAVKIGDYVLGQNGKPNQVLAIETPLLGYRSLFAFNGSTPFVTAEHPFLSNVGWTSIDPAATAMENNLLKTIPLRTGSRLIRYSSVKVPALQYAGIYAAENASMILYEEELLSITEHIGDPATPLYNLILDGNNTYFANKYLVHNKGDH